MTRTDFFVLATVLSLLFVCDASAQRSGGNIRRVDFKNFTYTPSCSYDNRPVRVRRGKFYRPSPDDAIDFTVRDVVYGDLTGDGRDEAVVVSTCSTGGTGWFTEGYVYTMRGNRPVEIVRLEAGDRAFGGIVGVKIARGLLTVERYAPQEEGVGACCPVYVDTIKYRLQGHQLIQVGRTERRNAEIN